MASTNTAALFADRGAVGVRPYCAAYITIGNGWLAYNFLSVGQPLSTMVCVASAVLNAVNAGAIAYYRRKATM